MCTVKVFAFLQVVKDDCEAVPHIKFYMSTVFQ